MLQHDTPVMQCSRSWFASYARTISSPNMPCIRSPIFFAAKNAVSEFMWAPMMKTQKSPVMRPLTRPAVVIQQD